MIAWFILIFYCIGAIAIPIPPEAPPQSLLNDFTVDGRIPIENFYVDDTDEGRGTHYKFPKTLIDAMIIQAQQELHSLDMLEPEVLRKIALAPPPLQALKKRQQVYATLLLHAKAVIGQNCVVFGSMDPWIEAFLLGLGAHTVLVVEYNKLSYDHPQITTVSPNNKTTWAKLFTKDSYHYHRYNLAISISSFDHDGLGRYGDPINPDGDILAMGRVKSLLVPIDYSNPVPDTGIFVLTVPLGPDVLVWNLHRRYGVIRLPMLLQGWDVIETVAGLQDWDIRLPHETVVKEARAVNKLLTTAANWRQTREPVFVLRPVDWTKAKSYVGDEGRVLPRIEL